MATPFFSIILPIYNAVNYITATLNQISSQSFQDYELLIVDDGATDGTQKIVRDYANESSKTVYIEQHNNGISNARNVAIQRAKGKYLVFCDHDDIMSDNCLEILFNVLSDTEFDVINYSYENQVLFNDKLTKQYDLVCDKACGGREVLKDDYSQFNNFIYTVWNSAYKTTVVRERKLTFDETIKSGMEDVVFNLQLLEGNISICMLPDKLYRHYIRYGQSTSRRFDLNKLDSIILSFDLEESFFKNNDQFQNSKFHLLQMNKYIRSFFVAINTKKDSLSDPRVQDRLKTFRKKIDYHFSVVQGLRYSLMYPKEFIKIVLFKLYLYKPLFYLLRGQ